VTLGRADGAADGDADRTLEGEVDVEGSVVGADTKVGSVEDVGDIDFDGTDDGALLGPTLGALLGSFDATLVGAKELLG
jgi:hypothetical protein